MALDTALSVALAPLLLAQTALTVRRAERLPEPEGPRSGRVGQGPRLRFLQLGDSSAVGVGVERQEDALAPQLAAALGAAHRVEWTLCGENGATTADAPRLLAPVTGKTFDLAFVIFGVNDAKNLRPAAAWRRDYGAALDLLRSAHGARKIFVSGLPPVEEFPLIPHPLRTVLSLRVRRFDRILQSVAAVRPGCIHIPLPCGLNVEGMARDGFHPGAPIYAEWALRAAEVMRPHILEMTRPDKPEHEGGEHEQNV